MKNTRFPPSIGFTIAAFLSVLILGCSYALLRPSGILPPLLHEAAVQKTRSESM